MSVVGAVECRGFRNLAAARTSLAADVVVVHGPNGAGKTNLLEAVYFGLTGRSFRAGDDRDLIRYGEQRARVELELAEGGELLAALDRSGERRHLLSGRALSGDPGERPLVSVFHPDRLALVKAAPAHRRAHLDRLCGAIWPARADLRRRFGRTLAQRNALVARVRAGLGGTESLASWDERLAAEAEPLIAARADAVDALAEPFSELACSSRPRRGRGLLSATGGGQCNRARHRAGAAPRGGPGARLYLLRATAGRGRAAVRGPAATALRLPGPATAGAARAALRGARRAARGGAIGTADAARRRDE